MKTSKNTKLRKYISTILIFIIFFWGSQFLFERHSIRLQVEDGNIHLSAEDTYQASILNGQVVDCQIVDHLPEANLVNGYDGIPYHYGNYNSDSLGDFQIFINDRIDSIIYVKISDDSVLFFNYESEAVTRQLYEAIKNM